MSFLYHCLFHHAPLILIHCLVTDTIQCVNNDKYLMLKIICYCSSSQAATRGVPLPFRVGTDCITVWSCCIILSLYLFQFACEYFLNILCWVIL